MGQIAEYLRLRTVNDMPLRSFIIAVVCATLVAGAALLSSRTVGSHKMMQDRIEEILTNDTIQGGVERNLSPYCFLGACPKVAMRTAVPNSVGETERIILMNLRKYQYTARDGSASWRTYTRPGNQLRYRLERDADGSGTLIYWEASPRF
jgi:hypothetical protein